ncbi:MAG: sugar transferase [Chloroflexi bacterium]|nr:sugar transferase [Chloroflexota bacterium]MBV9543205.1 sugar transferase [Chloroflexota bacterium]
MALTSPRAVSVRRAEAIRPAATEVHVREPLLKRPFDFTLAALMLVVSAPVWAVIAAAIKLEDRGPIFYRQERWGRHQKRFHVLKFRSMIQNSDRDFGVLQARIGDRRVTRVGRVLRATGLDELPQVLNILRGEMSFVGPRPLATNEKDSDGRLIAYERTPGFALRLMVRPGLTGLATVYLHKDAPSRRKFRTDLVYVRRISFWLDLRLVALSFWISFRGKWETRSNKV